MTTASPETPAPPADAESILAALDPEQREVARTFGTPVCVLAGAGTGKTRALTHRIAYGVATGQLNPRHVLAVTFTAKAAAESWTLALADSFKETSATANVIVVNAILTPAMRAENPDKPFRTFTSAEEIAEATCFVCSDAAAKMNGQRLSLHP